ncbi:MAG: MATE family efflux transporter [Clostridia bacterium]|nr:MATE family efflux transporter [Clostridia bacterium]
MVLSKRRIDLTSGPLFPAIVRFAIPLIIGSLVQLLFNAVDIVVLGKMADTTAQASVSATSAVTSLLINSFIGFSTGTNIILARFLGAKDRENVRKTVDTSILAAGAIGVLVAIAGLFLSPLLLNLTNCPDACLDGASLYLRIYLFSTPAILIYNFGAAIIRVSGDTKRPLYYIIASGLLNVALNIILCFILEQKVAAVAIATFASQVLSAALVVIHLVRMSGDCRMNLRKLVFDLHTLGRILRFGLPSAVTHSLYCIPNLMIQSTINQMGPAVMAGNTSAASIEGMIGCVHNGFGAASMTFVGQNLGAGNNTRVKKSILYCFLVNLIAGAVIGISATALGRPLLRIYHPSDEAAVSAGMVRMKHISLFLGVGAVNALLANVLNAFGYPTMQTLCSLFSILGLRIVWMSVLFPIWPSIDMLFFCYTVSWCTQLVLLSSAFAVAYHKFKTGKLHKI